MDTLLPTGPLSAPTSVPNDGSRAPALAHEGAGRSAELLPARAALSKTLLIAFDIETGGVGEDAIKKQCKPFDPSDVKCGNIKDPDKVAEKVAAAEVEYYRRQVERAALDARTGEVLAVGILWPGDKFELLDGPESRICNDFWARWSATRDVARARWVGWNIFDFDLIFLAQRSWLHGVALPPDLHIGRPWNINFLDLMRRWSCEKYGEYASLDSVAKYFNVGGKSSDVTGATFAKFWRGTPAERDLAREYLLNDLRLTRDVARKILNIPAEDAA